MATVFIFIGCVVLFIIIMRLLGAWMLRINEVITLQKRILEELKDINKSGRI